MRSLRSWIWVRTVDEQLKRRLIGVSVLVALAIIFLPMLLSHKPVAEHSGKMADIPSEPAREFDPALLQDPPPKEAFSAPEPPPVDPEPATEKETSPVVPATPVVVAKPETKPKPVVAEKKPEKETVSPKPASSPFAWVVQVASFSSRDSADKLVKKLRKAGLDTMNPSVVTVAGKKYYRVRVGPEIDKKRAQNMLPRINRISGTEGQVVRYP